MVSCFAAFSFGSMVFSPVWPWVHAFPRFASAPCFFFFFAAFGDGFMSSRVWGWFRVFSRLALAPCFLVAVGDGDMSSRV